MHLPARHAPAGPAARRAQQAPRRWETGPIFNLDRKLGDLANAYRVTRKVATDHRDLAGSLERSLEKAQALAHELRYGGTRSRHREMLGEFQIVLVRALNRAHRLAAALAADLLRKIGKEAVPLNEPTGDLGGLVETVEHASNNFVGADLRLAILGSAQLDYIRWSDSTHWPGEWRDHVRSASVEIEPGVYRVNGWGERAHNTTVGM